MLIIKNAVVVSCDADHTVYENVNVTVQDGKFTDIGKGTIADSAEVLDAKGAILMPGLINMHAHCGDSLFRGLVEDLPLEPWLQTVWKAEGATLTDPAVCKLGTELGLAELILGGVTSVMDMFWHPETGFAAAEAAGVRFASGGLFFDFPGMDGKGPETRLDEARVLFEAGHEFCGVNPHGAYTVNPDNLKAAHALAQEFGGFFCTHAAETAFEQETIQTTYNMRIINHLDTLGILGPRTVLAHCVHVDSAEIALLAGSGTHVVHNPMSNLKLASGFAPVPAMLDAGINLTLGTDGPISGNDMDMWLAMRLAATLHKAATGNAEAVTTRQALHMATLNGAKALNAADRIGSIEVGKEADFIVVDISGPHAVPMFNPITHLVYSASKNDVRDVFVRGKPVMRNREILTLGVPGIVARVQALLPAIKATLEGDK